MNRTVPLLAFALAGCAPAALTPGGGPKGGIVSTNPCADQMLLALVAPERIAAISHYSQDPGATSIPLDVAHRFRATTGTAEEVIALKPDLVVASSFTAPSTKAAFERAGLKTLYLDSPTTIAASKAQVMALAAAVGAKRQGAALAQRIDAAVAKFTCSPIPSALSLSKGAHDPESRASTNSALTGCEGAPSALLFIDGDLANGGGTLLDELLTKAGFRDAAADYGLVSTGTLPVETIVSHPPAAILAPDAGGRTAALRRRVLAATGAKVAEIPFPRSLMNCGGPTIPAALARLAAIRRQVAP